MCKYVVYSICYEEGEDGKNKIHGVSQKAIVNNSADAVIIADMLEQRERELIKEREDLPQGCTPLYYCYGWKIKQGKWQEQAAELLKTGQKEGLYCIR